MVFTPIASRVLFVVNSEGDREEFSLAIGQPYRPAKTPGMADHAACLIEICGQVDEMGSEVFGHDELEALANALSHAHLLFTGLVAMGKVEWPDGTPFLLESKSEFTRTLKPMQDEVYRRFGFP
jgi:hypothetical protein